MFIKFKLIPAALEQAANNLPVQWCFDAAELEALAFKEKVREIYVLLVTRTKSGYEQRWLVRADELQQFVQFNAGGANDLIGLVFYSMLGGKGGAEKMRKLLNRPFRSFSCQLFNYNDEGYDLAELQRTIGRELELKFIALDSVKVIVSDKNFAPIRPTWWKHWISRWFGSEPANECEERGRLLVAIFIQPVVIFLLKPLLALIYAVWRLLLLNKQGIDWRPVINPLNYNPDDVRSSDYDDYPARGNVFLVPITPLIWLALFMIVVIVADTIGLPTGNWWLYLLITPLIFYSVLLLIVGIAWLLNLRWERKEARAEAAPPSFLDEKLLLCSRTAGDTVSFLPLPTEKRTWRVRFQETKARVCRPCQK
ncbi:MAG: hypothetical protein V1846_03170 [Candidatus Komeilibacteria bacterium]